MNRISCLAPAIAVCLAVATTTAEAQHEPHWTYSGHTGPENWGSLSPGFASCSLGRQQSPVDIPAGTAHTAGSLDLAYAPSRLNVVNNGHTIQAMYDAGSSMKLGDARYDLIQFHFHAPSEHTVAGRHEPLELHLVHRNAEHGLAVVGVLLREGSATAAYDVLLQNLPAAPGDSIATEGMTVDASLLLPRDRAYWSYAGSLTTPPCSEGVSWVVLENPVELSRAQIAKLTNLMHDNARPVQPLGTRTIKATQ